MNRNPRELIIGFPVAPNTGTAVVLTQQNLGWVSASSNWEVARFREVLPTPPREEGKIPRAAVVQTLSGYDVQVDGVTVVHGTNSMSAIEAAEAINAANGLPSLLKKISRASNDQSS